jgi:hypothetical protein
MILHLIRLALNADVRSGNLSQKSLLGIVKHTDLVEGSEFLETLFVAVPKYVDPVQLFPKLIDGIETPQKTGLRSMRG